MKQEQKYLENTIKIIERNLDDIERVIDRQDKQLKYLSAFYADQYSGMDEEEVAIHALDINTEEEKLALANQIKQKLLISKQSPYFGRIDFAPVDDNPQNIYVGVIGIIDSGDVPLVCDWRAPVSSMFYDYGKGRASYIAPIGKIEGEITLKRQYKIKKQKIEYMFDSDLNIDDEILGQSLAQNKTDKLENIVATIQTEQNKVIRNEQTKNLLVQGYAGSGKTTVALHRVAYLLYRYKNDIASDEIVLISPSDIFSNYISGVLPQLGEADIPQITFEDLARQYLKQPFEKRDDFIERIFCEKNIAFFKESFDYLNILKVFMSEFAKSNFVANDFVLNKKKVEKEKIEQLYFENYKNKDVSVRIDWIADYIGEELGLNDKEMIELKPRIKNVLYSNFTTLNIYEIYLALLKNIELSDYDFKTVLYEDIAPLIYIYGYLFGYDVKKQTKHLVVDEMQDYSPVQFELLNNIYPCAKTVVGDIYQSLYKNLDQEYLNQLCDLIGQCQLVCLNKTYRSTKQINQFAFEFLPSCQVEMFNRNGEEVEILTYNQDNFKSLLQNKIDELLQKYNKIAIITKNKQKAQALYFILDNENIKYDEECLGDITILPIGKSRGLEFDAVITMLDNPVSEVAKKCMFVGSTRALHKLVVFTSM